VTTGRSRARDLGIPFRGVPGAFNAITDIFGVEVGYCTVGGPDHDSGFPSSINTGVTIIFPRGKATCDPVFAGSFTLNGAGEMTGLHWVSESGFLESPIAITNTYSVGTVHKAVIEWQIRNGLMFSDFSLPVVAETYDGFLNDINGFHVREEDVLAAISDAKCAALLEGNVGGGNGMGLFGWKGGSGTSSRRVASDGKPYALGVFTQANFGKRHEAIVAGVPIGDLIDTPAQGVSPESDSFDRGSIIAVLATDAPLLPHQLNRLAKRCALGIARTGGNASNLSGDLIIAFSTANCRVAGQRGGAQSTSCTMLSNSSLDALFSSAADATEEAIINALVGAETMTGYAGHSLSAVPHDQLIHAVVTYNRPHGA
jgi:D-aminopeptidase